MNIKLSKYKVKNNIIFYMVMIVRFWTIINIKHGKYKEKKSIKEYESLCEDLQGQEQLVTSYCQVTLTNYFIRISHCLIHY